MKLLFIYVFIYLFSGCDQLKTVKKYNEEDIKNHETTILKDSLKLSQKNIDSNTIDSIKIGAKFYEYDAFKNYKFIEAEPYEFIELNDNDNSSQIMIYRKSNNYYAILVSAEDNIEKLDSGWKKSKKTIVDVVSFDVNFELCWYIYDGNYPPLGRFGIGTEINKTFEIDEYTNCKIYKKYKVFDVDYKKGKIEEVNKEASTFCCSDGY